MKKIKFARFGGLSPVVQKGYTTNPEKIFFHTPPARKGFYAFIWPHYDFFLLGAPSYSGLGTKNAKFEYLRDKDGNKIKYDTDNPLLKKHLMKGKVGNYQRDGGSPEISWKIWEINGFAVVKKSPKIFTHTGELWHHFKNKDVKPEYIIDEVGDWIKTDYDIFVKAFNRDKISNMNFQKTLDYFDNSNINPNRAYMGICIDHLEVFIEKIK